MKGILKGRYWATVKVWRGDEILWQGRLPANQDLLERGHLAVTDLTSIPPQDWVGCKITFDYEWEVMH